MILKRLTASVFPLFGMNLSPPDILLEEFQDDEELSCRDGELFLLLFCLVVGGTEIDLYKSLALESVLNYKDPVFISTTFVLLYYLLHLPQDWQTQNLKVG